MVGGKTFDSHNVSYVWVSKYNNKTAPFNSTTHSEYKRKVRECITGNLTSSDPLVVNAELMPKELSAQDEAPPRATVPLWSPLHLYTENERRPLLYATKTWSEMPQQEQVLDQPTTSGANPAPKRNLDEEATSSRPGNSAKVPKPDDDADLQGAPSQDHPLERRNTELQDRVREMEQRIEIMRRILKDPAKLSRLTAHLQEIRRPQKPEG